MDVTSLCTNIPQEREYIQYARHTTPSLKTHLLSLQFTWKALRLILQENSFQFCIKYIFNKVYFMFQQLFCHYWFRVHLKLCSSNHNTSMILKFRKHVSRLVTTGATNVKKNPSEGDTSLCKESPFTQVQMLKSSNSLLIKFNVSTQETIARIFFPLSVHEFFLDNSLV